MLFALVTSPLLKETTQVHLLASNCQTMKSYWDKKFKYKSVYVTRNPVRSKKIAVA